MGNRLNSLKAVFADLLLFFCLLSTSIYFAPLQSYTTIAHCLSFNQIVGGVDKFFTPFYRADHDGKFAFEPYLINRPDLNLVPQVLTNKANELIRFSEAMKERGFDEINLNIGCPFPMVVNRKLGSGLLPFPKDLRLMLTAYFRTAHPVKLSVKLRLGLNDKQEIKSVLKVLKEFDIEEIILHPRLGVQKYKGEPDWALFSALATENELVGNGDIKSLADLKELRKRCTNVKTWMIGRGLLENPMYVKA